MGSWVRMAAVVIVALVLYDKFVKPKLTTLAL